MSTQKRKYVFEVETLEAGQRRKYGDSYFHFIVENKSEIDYSDPVIREFCTGFLRKAIPEKTRKEQIQKAKDEGGDFFSLHFRSYYTKFEKIGDRKWEYKVTEPSTH